MQSASQLAADYASHDCMAYAFCHIAVQTSLGRNAITLLLPTAFCTLVMSLTPAPANPFSPYIAGSQRKHESTLELLWDHAQQSCLVLSCPVLSCLVLSCPVLSCLVLSCLVLSCCQGCCASASSQHRVSSRIICWQAIQQPAATIKLMMIHRQCRLSLLLKRLATYPSHMKGEALHCHYRDCLTAVGLSTTVLTCCGSDGIDARYVPSSLIVVKIGHWQSMSGHALAVSKCVMPCAIRLAAAIACILWGFGLWYLWDKTAIVSQ